MLACFIGGATEKWAEGIVVGLLGVLLLLNPPRFSLGPAIHGILCALLACGALAFLPANWFFQPAWRTALIDDFGVKLGSTLSPQPWISFGCLLSLIAGFSWFYYVCGQDVEIRAARRQLRIFAVGVILLAGLAVILNRAHTAMPFWHNQRGFGPFPNRNQTADLFGITAILILACAHDEIRRHKKKWPFWLAGLAVVIAAIVLNFSRAGIALLVVGCATWLGILILRTGSKGRIAAGVSALLILLTVLLVFGGQTLERFNLRGTGSTISTDFRWLIFGDAFALIKASPWTGIGLGNFEPIFAIFRDASIGQNRALHPESDWLWLWAEMGWLGVALIVIGAVLLVRRCFPFVEGTNQWFRTAALVAALLFALHAMVDVGGHRVGTAYAGIFLFGMSLRRPFKTPASAALINFFRVVGLALVLLGGTWVVATYRARPLPGSIGVDTERHLAKSANVGRHFTETVMHASRGLEWAPLDWQLYFLRALGEAGANREAEALDDFRRARFLEPNSFEVPYQEGVAWLVRDPLLAVTAWREGLRRAGEQRPELYSRMLSTAAQASPLVRQMLEDFGGVQADLALTFMERASGEQFDNAVERLLQHDRTLQSLNRKQRARFFILWIERGDLSRLNSFVEEQPDWMNLGWRGAAEFRASKGNFRDAIELAQRFGEKPTLPAAATGVSIEQLERDAFASANNYESGFTLFQLQMQRNKIDDALVTVRRFTSQSDAPTYFHFLESDAWTAKGDWERAWAARKKFDSKP